MMLFFSSVNLGLDVLNVTCFSKVQNFSFLGDLNARNKDDNRQEQSFSSRQPEEEEALLLQNGTFSGGDDDDDDDDVECPPVQEPSPSKRRYEFPPSIIVDTSIDSSFESNKSSEVNGEDMGLLGIAMPNYGSQKSDHEWGEEFSLDAVYGGGSGVGSQSDGLTSSAASLETRESLDSGAASSVSNGRPSRKSKAIEIGFADELDGISEGDENDISGDNDASNVIMDGKQRARENQNGNDENDDDDEDDESDASARGFNLNMCSAYTVSGRADS
jgi:hypothetical protein